MSDQKKEIPPGCPMHAGGELPEQPRLFGKDELTYNDYLKVPELLALQIPQSEPAHHDEMLFIIIHQAYELWFKLILHEAELAVEHMQAGEVMKAQYFINRIVQIMKLLVQQIHLLETMAPADFLAFRDRLMPASGFQSTQFREVEFMAGLKDERYLRFFRDRPEFLARLQKRMNGPDFRICYFDMVRKLGFPVPADAAKREAADNPSERDEVLESIRPIFQKPHDHLPLYLLSESLIEFDEYLGLWREHHVRVVERVIGFKRGSGGSSGAQYLRSTTSKRCFPSLWEVRTVLQKG